MDLTVETFQAEITEALKAYDKHVVCIDKTPEECTQALMALMDKAIRAYVSRGPHLRRIYFNLHSPYKRKSAVKARKED
jgi:hypothetical protein